MKQATKALAACAILATFFASSCLAGWNDFHYSSPQEGASIRQGGNITLSLNITNSGVSDGGAGYIANITLQPGHCINNGSPITVPGAIICPKSMLDSACVFRFRNATQTSFYEFINLSVSESCPSGQYSYSFLLEGNSELLAGGIFSETNRTSNPAFTFTFLGPRFCGDGSCDAWKNESCSSCPGDCGICPSCSENESRCIGDSIAVCGPDRQWELTPCQAGCALNREGGPECVPPCSEGDRHCSSSGSLSICSSAGRWQEQACPYGCVFDDCKGSCESAGCPDKCIQGTAYSNGTCSRVTGNCTYSPSPCSTGCDSAGTSCATPPATPPPPGGLGSSLTITIVLAGIAIVALSALTFHFKSSQNKKKE